MESKQEWQARIDAHRDAQTCSICGKHLDYSEGWYTANHSHYACAFPKGVQSHTEQFNEAAATMDKAMAAMAAMGFKPKRQQAKLGDGGPTKKLKEIIEISAREHFEAAEVSEINIYLPPPVWRQARFDVQRVEGNMRVDGRTITFGSWVNVSELIKYRRVKWNDDWPGLDMFPVYETKRNRSRVPP